MSTSGKRAQVNPLYTLKLSRQLRDLLRALSKVSERPMSWMLTQSLLALFREIERGQVLAEDIRANKRGTDYVDLCITVKPVWKARLEEFKARQAVSMSQVVRFALSRYLVKRQHFIGTRKGKELFLEQDPMMEIGPILPP